MFILKSNKIKWLFIILFLILCSCQKEVEEPQETYTITFVTNGHGEQPENLTEQTNLPDPLPILSEEGWTFGGWFTTSIFEPASKAVSGTEIVEDTTLYAKWTEVVEPTPPPVKTYSITFVKNGHGWNDIENLTNQTHLPNLKKLIEDGWRFEGWYYDNETFEEPAVAGTKLTEDTILYAKWTEVIPFYIVEYKINSNNAGTIIGETHQKVYRGEDSTPVTVIPNVGYKFLGWNSTGLATDGTERVDEITRMDTNVQKHITAIAVFQGPITCEMRFRANEGGKVEGILDQQVLYGGKGETVTAIPDEEFRFGRWSDGETEAVRTNECVTYYPSYTPLIYAEFERCERKFKLEYNEGTSDTELTEYTFYLDDMEKEQYLPVPQREGYEFDGWYSDWFHKIQVTDETGKMIVDRDWFNNNWLFWYRTNPDMKLFAKWKPIKEVPVYKILLIFVTEVHATLESSYKGMMQVDYVMNDVERILCEQVPVRMESYLEAILNGTVDFQIDTYFTKQPVVTEDFIKSSSSYDGITPINSYLLNRNYKPLQEVKDMQENYDSVLTTFSLNDPNSYLYVGAGVAGKKYGNLHLEDVIGTGNLEYRLDITDPLTYRGYVHQMEFYIHELTHTIELQLQNEDFYGIHATWDYYVEKIGGAADTEFDFLCDYLRNEFNVGDRNVGIPYEFWTGEYQRQ